MIASRVTLIAVLSVAGAAFVVASATAGGGKPQKRTVQIADNYYNPSKLTVNRGSTVSWKWPEVTGDSHNAAIVTCDRGTVDGIGDLAQRRRIQVATQAKA